jgi:hypothetical protein
MTAFISFPSRSDARKIRALRLVARAQLHLAQEYFKKGKWTNQDIAIAFIILNESRLAIEGKPSKLRKRGKKA